jgi:hypothetical protein
MKFRYYSLLAALGLIPLNAAAAFCPVCTVAVAGGLGLSRWLGIDDTVSGVWLGALMVALTVWTKDWLVKKNVKIKGLLIITGAAYYLMVVGPMYYYDVIGHPFNVMWGMDKLLLGVIAGSIFFILFHQLYQYLKKRNNGHAHFPFEKVALPLSPLIAWSIIFYWLTK